MNPYIKYIPYTLNVYIQTPLNTLKYERHLMDIASFKQTFDPLLARHLASKQHLYTSITSNKSVLSILNHIQNVSQGGKRLRPYIIWSLYASQKEDARIEDILPLLTAIELFHVFCLIHDDIMDESSLRHGTPTIHTYTTETVLKNSEVGNTVRAGESQAILSGDILFNQVYALLNQSTWLDAETREKVCTVFTILVDEVCIGQMLDIDLTTKKEVTNLDISEKNKLKTAYYSFARPLHIGTLISQREDLTEFVISFGECIGILFQIQDDLLDIIGNKEHTKKETLLDIAKNQHTILTEYIRKSSDQIYKEKLDTLCGTNIENINKNKVLALFEESGAIAYAKQSIEDYISKAQHLIAHAQLDSKDEKLFTTILSLLIHRTS